MVASSRSSQAEFVLTEFDTNVTDEDIYTILSVLDESISRLLIQLDHDTLDPMLRADSGDYYLRESMTRDNLQPEPYTQDAVIEPLLDALGHDVDPEASTLSDKRGERADYTISLRQYDQIDSTRLLIEAEPINKALDSRGHGVNQVESWLSQREFESDYGFATDGLRWILIRYDADTYTHDRIEHVDLSGIALTLFENQTNAQQPVEDVITDEQRDKLARFISTFKHENFVAIAGDAHEVIRETQEAITDEFYADYIQFVFGVVEEDDRDERAQRSLIADGIIEPGDPDAEHSIPTGIPDDINVDPDHTRLFAVKVMNRLIFIKFLEDKHIVDPKLLSKVVETYDDGVYPGSLYKTFIETLFFDVMNSPPEKRTTQIQSIDLFANIPYLNGGLFRPYIGENQDLNERVYDIHDSVLKSIINLLHQYDFSADGGPTDLDPSVLGNVFEKTINYLTTDPGDRNKELGAFYTPSEITRFAAERTVRPALLDRFKHVLHDQRGWPEYELDNFDTIYELIEGLPGSMKTIGPLLDEVDQFRVVDPAVGSGHFLTSVLEEIVSIRKALFAQNEAFPHEFRLKKRTVRNNIYGVDIVGPAVEIAKLRSWLSIISELNEEDTEEFNQEDIALPNIAFNIREGNSLIGFTGFPDTTDDENGYTLKSFTEDSVRDRYHHIIEEINQYEQAGQESLTEQAEEHRHNAFEALEEAREDLLPQIHEEFVNAGIDEITVEDIGDTQPFNWVLEYAEVYADGGFDVVIGNPPWDQISPHRDDYFTRYDPEFRTLLPGEKQTRQEELLEDKAIAEGWEDYKRETRVQADYFNKSDAYTLQRPTVAGRTEATDNDLSALFLERVFQISRDDGYVSQVLPGAIFNGSSAKDLRLHLLDDTEIQSIVTFENKGIFPEIDNRYNFGVIVFKNHGKTDELRALFHQNDIDVLQDFNERSISLPREVLRKYSPEAAIFPYIESEKEVDILELIFKHPSLSESKGDSWHIDLYSELHRRGDDERYIEDSDKGDYPVYGGRNIYQYMHDSTILDDLAGPKLWSVAEQKDPDLSAKRRIREKQLPKLKRAIYEAFDGAGSQKGFVNDLLKEHRGKPLTLDDIKLDCSDYRIVIRNIARSTDERTMIAAVIPPGIVCHHAINTIQKYKISPDEQHLSGDLLHSMYDPVFSDEELFVTVGILNSLPFDFLMRTKVDSNIVMYKLEESQAPRLTKSDEWFEYIWRRAARLNCYGDTFEKMRERLGGITPATDMNERRQIQSEIDAAVFHAYGLDEHHVKFVLDDFHRVRDPRVMDDKYFEMVLAKYRDLADGDTR